MQLSKLEDRAYGKLRENKLYAFKIKDLCLLLSIDRVKAYNLVKALKKKNVIKNYGKGLLAFKDAEDFVIAVNLNWPSYVSFWSALNYYGFSDNLPNKIFLATTRYAKETSRFKYVTLAKQRFFGYKKIGEFAIAEKEKAFVDCLLFPKYCGGIKEIIASLESAKGIDIQKLLDYAMKINSKSVLRRLGFILERLNYKKNVFAGIKNKIGEGYELLDPSLKKKNNLNKTWLLDVNI